MCGLSLGTFANQLRVTIREGGEVGQKKYYIALVCVVLCYECSIMGEGVGIELRNLRMDSNWTP